MKLIDYHHQWMETRCVPNQGLCNTMDCFNHDEWLKYYILLIKFFKPDTYEQAYWAYGVKYPEGVLSAQEIKLITTKYTPLRQTIVLFICAMYDEL